MHDEVMGSVQGLIRVEDWHLVVIGLALVGLFILWQLWKEYVL